MDSLTPLPSEPIKKESISAPLPSSFDWGFLNPRQREAEDRIAPIHFQNKVGNFLWNSVNFLSDIPSDIHGLYKSLKIGDKDLAAQEAANMAVNGALLLLPIERPIRWAGNLAKKVPYVEPALAKGGELASSVGRFLGKPIGDFLTKHLWNKILPEEQKVSPTVANLTAAISKGARTFEKGKKDVKHLKELAGIPSTIENTFHPGVLQQSLRSLPQDASQFETDFHLTLNTVLHSFSSILNHFTTGGVPSIDTAERIIQNKIQGSRRLKDVIYTFWNTVDKEGRKNKIPNLASQIFKAVENKDIFNALPNEYKRLPGIVSNFFDSAHSVLQTSGMELNHLEEYIPHIIRLPRQQAAAFAKNLMEYVPFQQRRDLITNLDTLKAATKGDLPNIKDKMGNVIKLPEAVGNFLLGKKIVEDPKEMLYSYTTSWAHAMASKSVSNIIIHSAPMEGLSLAKGALTPENRDTLIQLMGKTMRALGDKNPVEYEIANNMKSTLERYVAGDRIGMDDRLLYHPKIAQRLGRFTQGKETFSWESRILKTLSFLKAVKFTSLFHAFQFYSTLLASGEGLDNLFKLPFEAGRNSILKGLGEKTLLSLEDRMTSAGTNLFSQNRAFQEIWDTIDEKTGDSQFSKIMHSIEENPFSKVIFQKIGRYGEISTWAAYRKKLALKYGERGGNPELTKQLDRLASQVINIKFGSIRPELMNSVVKDVSNHFLLARNYTLSNLYNALNAFHEFFLRYPEDLKILPPQLSNIFSKMLGGIQSFQDLPIELQREGAKELANYTGAAVAQKMWRLQIANILTTGHLTYDNTPGHELQVDSNIWMPYQTQSGRYDIKKIYFDPMGWSGDVLRLLPFHAPIPEAWRQGPSEFLNPLNYSDLSKFGRTVVYKGNFFVNLGLDLAKEYMAKGRVQNEADLFAKAFDTVSPISLITYLQNREAVTGIDDALELAVISVIGFPKVLSQGSSIAEERQRWKNAQLPVWEKIKRGVTSY